MSTVSHVVNRTRPVGADTTARVESAIARLGYRHNYLARAVARGGRTHSIGVALSARSNPYFAEVVAAMDEAITEMGSSMLLGETRDDVGREARLINSLLERRVDGIIVALAPDPHGSTTSLLRGLATPSVLIDRLAGSGRLDEIGSENVEPVAQLVDHLAQAHGHRRIALVAGLAGLSTTDERRRGFTEGLKRNGLDARRPLVVHGESSSPPAEHAMAKLLSLKSPPTAVVVGNNAMAVGALRFLKHEGIRVPDDLAVCAFDDFEWAELMAAPLSCVAQDWSEIGRGAVALLARRLADPSAGVVSQRVRTALHLRNSCGCP